DEARDSVHERRLPRSVRADQPHDLPPLERQVDAVDRPDALEVDANLLRDQFRGARAVDGGGHRLTSRLLPHGRRLAPARAAVADVWNEVDLPVVHLLVLAVRPLLDRVRSRLWTVARGRELHLRAEVVHRHLPAEQGVRDLRAVSRAGLLDRRHDRVGERVARKRIVVAERGVVGRLELLGDRAHERRLRAVAVRRQAGEALGVEVRHVAGHLLDEDAVDRGVRRDRYVDARRADRLYELRSERLPGAVEDRVAALDLAAQTGDLRGEVEVRAA